MIGTVLWVLVADGGRSRVYAVSRAGALEAVPGLGAEGPHMRDREIGTDRPARVFAAAGSAARSSLGEHGELSEAREREFLGTVVRTLVAPYREGTFERLLVVAPPRVLGFLRPALDAALPGCPRHEVGSDLAGLPIPELAERLREPIRAARR